MISTVLLNELVNKYPQLADHSSAYREAFLEKLQRQDAVEISPTYRQLILQLKTILNRDRAYSDVIDRFVRVNIEPDNSISGSFLDGRKLIDFRIKDNKLTYKLSKTSRVDSEVREDRSRRKSKCVKGIPCKNSCISSKKSCILSLSEVASPGEVTKLRSLAVNLKLERNAANTVAKTPQAAPVPDYVTNPETGQEYTIRELKKVASNEGVTGYSSMTKEQLQGSLRTLNEAKNDPEYQENVAKTLTKDRSSGNRAIKASGIGGRPKRSAQDANRTWRNLNALAKFAGSQPVGWGAAAIGAFMLGVTIRSYERAKSDYRMHFKEAAEQAEERASTLGSARNGALKRTGAYKNITFVVSAGKGYGAEEVQKQLEKFQSSEDEGDQWLGKNHFFVPFNLREGGARKGGSDIENSINGLQDYVRNFKRGKDQDAVDLAAQIYGYGIQRQLKTRYQNELESLDRRYKTLSQQRSSNEPLISNLKETLEQSVRDLKGVESAYKKTPSKALERELKLKAKKRAEAELKFNRVNVKFQEVEKELKANRSQHGKISSRPDIGTRDLANKDKNINILAHSRGGQTSKTALEYLARMQLKGEPSGKEILEQVNLVMLGTPHFGFTENVSKRQRTIISARDPISTLPVFGEGARQQWISTVKGHDWKDYLEDKNVREALKENFGYYEDSLLERTRRQRKGDSEEVILDAKKPLCKTGKPCVGESGKTICIPKSHKCTTEKLKTPEKTNLKFAPPLVLIGVAATAGIGLVVTGSVVAGATHVVKKDLEKSEVDFNSIRQPPGGVPDEETFKKYDTFEKGDLIRKNFKSDNMGTRQHYAVYMGKTVDPKTKEPTHWCIDTGENWKHRDKVPFVMARGLTWNSGPNDSEYEKVPKEEMHLVKGTKQLSREEIADRAEKMLYQRFHYQGFESNCEAFARGIVEGKAYSQQGMKVSPLTNFVSKVVTDNVLKIRTNQNKILGEWEGQLAKLEAQGLGDSPEGKKLKTDIKNNKAQQARFGIGEEKPLLKLGGNEVTGLTEYAKDKYKMNAQQMVDYLEREKVMQERRKWEDLINPYEGTYEKGYLGRKEESGILAKGNYPDRKNNAQETRLGFRPFGFLVKNTRKDSELDQFFDAIGLKSPEEIDSIADAIAGELPAIGDYIKIEIYKNYLLALFGMLTQDSEEVKLDAKIPECKTGKACKSESGKTVCIPKTHKCSSEINSSDKKTLAIAGGGVVASAAMVAAYVAARDILTTIDTEKIERDGNTVLTKDKVKDIKLEKKIGEQGATSDTYFVQDAGQQKYVFKQSKPAFYNQAASEVVVSEMALKAGINVNKTKLIPNDVGHPLKDSGRAATLHSLAPGSTMRDAKNLPSLPLSQKQGLDRKIIKSISYNPELAKIAALDTFTSNWDRNPGNIFYDEKTKSFQGIDLGVAYSRVTTNKAISPPLSAITRKNLSKLDIKTLSESEKQGLNTYLGTLKTLYTENPPDEITKRHAKYLKLSGGNWDIFRRYVSVKQIFDDHKETGRLIYDLGQKLNSTPKKDSIRTDEGIACGKGFISRGEKCNSGAGRLKAASHSFRKTLTSATERSGNSIRKTGQVARSIASPNETPDVVRKAAKNVKYSTLQSIKEDPELIKELIGVARNNPDFVKGLIDMEIGRGSKRFTKASIKDPAARKALAKIALKPKIHKSLLDLVGETVGYIVRKDSESSTDYVLGFVVSQLELATRTDAKGKKCGKGYIPARAKCKVGLGANLKRSTMSQGEINTALAATGAIAGVAALGVAGGTAVAVSANNLKQAKVERELAQIQRERAEEALKKAEELAKQKEEEEKEEARTLKQEVAHSLKKVGAAALGAGVPLGLTGGPGAGFAGAGIAATKTGIEETARIVRKRKTKKSEFTAEVLETIAPGIEEGLKTSGTKKEKLKAFSIASANKANEKAIAKLTK